MKRVRRLYDQFRPLHYELELLPDRDSMTFKGVVVMSGHKVGRPSKRISLHQKGLRITSTHVIHHTKHGDVEIPVNRTNSHNSFDELRLHANTTIFPGKYTISLNFMGKITPQMNGIYPCNYKYKGATKTIIATQFESHHAREVFPCIDEPEAKATFDLTLHTPASETVIANTPIISQSDQNNTLITRFERTPHMSTYLLAFVYGKLDYLESKTKGGVLVRTYGTPENVEHTRFALDTAVRCLEFYNDYFNIAYPLPKCDMIALPDFASGAMENWGLITYREQAMLVDKKHTSLASKQYVAMVVAHELAHQWFGNLVTMRWWTDLWLNEGFASWIEYLAVDDMYPDWKMWTQFVVDEQQQALKLDALEHTHPIEVPIKHPDEIRTIFDAISYSKGSSIINMLYRYLGPKTFQAGLQYYLKKYAYKNTDTIDLWDALEKVSDKPVRQFMQVWTSQSGYPLVQAVSSDNTLELSQQRFVLNPARRQRVAGSTIWPIALLSGKAVDANLFDQDSASLHVVNPQSLKLNRGESGFYRVAYNASHLEKLGHRVQQDRLEPIDRLGILADTFEAAKAGYCDTTLALNLLDSYRQEQDNAVWDIIAANLAGIRAVMDDEDLRDALKPYTRRLVHSQLTRLGWKPAPKESHFDRLLRPTILGMAALAEEPSVEKKALDLFAKMHNPEDVPIELREQAAHGSLRNGNIDPDMRGVVYGTAARLGGQKEFDKMLSLHNNTSFSEERLNLCAAMCGFKQPKIIDQTLSLITSEHVRLQDVAYWIAYSFANRFARKQAWLWLKDNWKWLEHNLGTDLSFYRTPVYVARGFSDANFLPEFSEFFDKHMSPAFERNIKQGIEIIEWQAAWRKRDLKLIKSYFSSLKAR